ncbi:flagellar biosynthetic protein FliO (plasmid) [Pontibacillus sp. ALD_SL1]|uniref:flagellar biosynthetic protein FliO n=1 Tax=Pontibacillus sp. ALD_SL1 TaxID=2777185 RepID=UPI001A958711|nr:flagellar biosynthetic protein FliO [Pontibacillus sp. ALD_SL1]QST03046.1 flagellar biosynthetic protein FliO [Pontibacillus sp. ALD_SL1]
MEYLVNMLQIFLVLGVFTLGTYLLMKKLKNKQFRRLSSNRMIQVIDGVQIGMKDEVMLLKIGSEYIVMSTNNGQMIGLRQKEILPIEDDFHKLLQKDGSSPLSSTFVQRLKKKVARG